MGIAMLILSFIILVVRIVHMTETANNQTSEVPPNVVLIKKLVQDYQKSGGRLVIPNQHINDTLAVQLHLNIIAISDVIIKRQMFVIEIWTHLRWTDYRLRWDPSKFDGIDDVRFPIDNLWVPDVVPYMGHWKPISEVNFATLGYNGVINWIRPMHLTFYCEVNGKRVISGKKVKCQVTMGSWNYGGQHLELKILAGEGVGLDDYFYTAVGWTVANATSVRNVRKYKCCPGISYFDITYTFKIEKQ